MKDPEDPSPVPEGISASDTISNAGLDLVVTQHLADDPMLDLVDRSDPLELGVFEQIVLV